jgi:pyruvate kinase
VKFEVIGCSGGQIPGHNVSSYLVNDSTLIDTMIKAAMELTYKKGVIMTGDKVVIVAVAPSAPPGKTDFLRVTSMNSPPSA